MAALDYDAAARCGGVPARGDSAAIVVDRDLRVRGRTAAAVRLLRANLVFAGSSGRLSTAAPRDAATLSRAIAIAESEGAARCALNGGALDVKIVRLYTARDPAEFVLFWRGQSCAALRPGAHTIEYRRRQSKLMTEVWKVLMAENA